MLTVAGLHTPGMPLVELDGNMGAAAPAHKFSDVPKLNVGVLVGVIVTVKVVVVAHNPAVGVKVYVPGF